MVSFGRIYQTISSNYAVMLETAVLSGAFGQQTLEKIVSGKIGEAVAWGISSVTFATASYFAHRNYQNDMERREVHVRQECLDALLPSRKSR
jgi:hypothetical protein